MYVQLYVGSAGTGTYTVTYTVTYTGTYTGMYTGTYTVTYTGTYTGTHVKSIVCMNVYVIVCTYVPGSTGCFRLLGSESGLSTYGEWHGGSQLSELLCQILDLTLKALVFTLRLL